MPERSLPKRFSRFSEARFAVSLVAPAYWSLEIRLDAGSHRLELGDEAFLARRGRGRAFLVAKEQDLPLASQEPRYLLGRELPALEVVGGHEADDLLRGQIRVDDDGGDPELLRVLDRPHQGLVVERREHDAAHPLARESLDHLHLLLAVVLADRPLPDDLDVDPFGLQVARGLVGASMDALPELVGQPLRDDRDLVALLPRVRGGSAASALAGEAGSRGREGQQGRKPEPSRRAVPGHRCPPVRRRGAKAKSADYTHRARRYWVNAYTRPSRPARNTSPSPTAGVPGKP